MEHNQQDFRMSDLELFCILRYALRCLWMLAAAAAIGFFGARLVLSQTYVPQYTSRITFAVTAKSGISSVYGNMTKANEIANVFTGLLESELMEQEICSALGTTRCPAKVQAAVSGETNLLVVSATAPSPKDAFLTVRAVKDHYADVSAYIDESAVLYVLSDARLSFSPSNPLDMTHTCIMAAGGCALVTALLLAWLFIMRDTVQTRSGARHKLDGRVLLAIPHEKGRKKRSRLLMGSPGVSFYFTESFYHLRTAVEHQARKQGKDGSLGRGVTVLVTSVTAGEGKSTVAANLALALAQKHKAVMLIDADLRNPTQLRIFGKKLAGGGLESLLHDGVTLDEIAHESGYSKEYNLVTLFPTSRDPDPGILLNHPAMERIIVLLRDAMDFIVIDSPPIGMFAESDAIASLADQAIMVIRQDVVPACDLNDGIDTLCQSGAHFLGCVLNDMRNLGRGPDGYSYGYGYGKYGYGKYGYGASAQEERDGAANVERENDDAGTEE